ncbi:hypothetical protein AHF37_07958, partial [Paragonimus kellicotti]
TNDLYRIDCSLVNKRHLKTPYIRFLTVHITEIHDVQLGCSTRAAHSLNRRRQLSLTPASANPLTGGSGNALQFNHNASRSPTTIHRHTLTTSATSSPVLPLGQANAARLNLTSSTFTITYGPDFDALELLANSPEEADIWVTGIKCLMTGAQDPHLIEERQKPRDSLTPASANPLTGGSGNALQFNHNASRSPTTIHRHTLTTSATSSPVLPLGQANAARLNLTSSTFTITYGPDFDALELLANSPEEADIWVTGIKCLMTGAQGKAEL